MLIKAALVAGVQRDIRCHDGFISEIADDLRPVADERVIQAHGGSLIPGLHDHHMHFFATAALQRSVDCGSREVLSPSGKSVTQIMTLDLCGCCLMNYRRTGGYVGSTITKVLLGI